MTYPPTPLADKDKEKPLTPEEQKKRAEARKNLMNALWYCNPEEQNQDLFSLGFDAIGRAFKGENIGDTAKEAAVKFCQNTTNCYIRDQIRKFGLVFGGAGLVLLLGGMAAGYGIGKRR